VLWFKANLQNVTNKHKLDRDFLKYFFWVFYFCGEWDSELKEFQGLEPRKPRKKQGGFWKTIRVGSEKYEKNLSLWKKLFFQWFQLFF
jgi:hypothetical protein